ncbi:hypothetical protein AVEN_24408-1 [Araneus ventricosus]|uniref:Uncharacterized protein n=1 Tax=Araneus ventricosus TaxID=182803 RepID=A0A4Y2Q1W3_ARAVE|nr:hypothetical protein AVEN_24408-1 [Araneus ventricosus]
MMLQLQDMSHMSTYNDSRSNQLWLTRVNVSPVIITELLPYCQDRPLSDVATSAARIGPLVARKMHMALLWLLPICEDRCQVPFVGLLAIAARSGDNGGTGKPGPPVGESFCTSSEKIFLRGI